jgi:hypothetical protein
MLFALLPPITFVMIFFIFFSCPKKDRSLRRAWISAVLGISVLTIFFVEISSAFNSLNRFWIISFWATTSIITVAFSIWKIRPHLRPEWKIFSNPTINLLAAGLPLAVLLFTFVVALVAPPNNTDAMIYHMSRVVHWIQNQSVQDFATSTLRELYLSPFAEYSLLTSQLLSGSDQFANLVQWFGLINSVVAVSLITELLGASQKGQYFAAVFVITLPQVLLQATSTQNDLVFSAFALISIYIILRFIKDKDWIAIPFAITATALAILTKDIGFIFLAPFVIWFMIVFFKNLNKQRLFLALIGLLIAACLVFPFFYRNYQLFGNPLGPQSETALYKNDSFSIPVTTINIIRNVAINLTYTDGINAIEQKVINKLHSWLGFSLSDPNTTWQGYPFSIKRFSVSEDLSGNPIHIWIIALALIFLLVKFKNSASIQNVFLGCVILGFILFCAYLKWQPWNNRLEMVVFLMMAPLVGLIAGNFSFLPKVISGLLFLSVVPYLLFNPTKPILQDWNIFNLPRREAMIRTKDILGPYIDGAIAIGKVSDCDQYGMILENGYWEYPLWSLLKEFSPTPIHLEHVQVDNASSRLEVDTKTICGLVVVNSSQKAKQMTLNQETFHLIFAEEPLGVYHK